MSTILLVVDDEPDVQLLMKQKFRRQIREEDYRFIFASNGVEALEMLKNHSDIDVVLCDVNMPQMDGITLLTKTREVNTTIQTIIVSAYGDMRNIRRAMNHGAFDFVTKPINFNDLGATIEKTIRHVKKLKENNAEKERLYKELEAYSKNLEQKVAERTVEITKQKQIIEAKNHSITESINYAKRIQEAALPSLEEIKAAFEDSFVYFKPRDIVSGDFFWFRQRGSKTIITAVDCTGHGVPGAFMSLIGNDILHEIIDALGITDANIILNSLHMGILRALRQTESNSRDGMDIALCVIDTEKKVLQYAGARSPLLYVRNGEVHEIKADKLSIGGAQQSKERSYTVHNVPLDGNTMFYIFSDGYQDQFGGPEGQKIMRKGLKNIFLGIHKEKGEVQREKLEEYMTQWVDTKYNQLDDMLIIGFKA
ncbi:MAG: response regulator [Cytophagales bacterium]|nr:MAG: response regulator [Cytophagales bacterium]TAF59960.1 MAG: response regulator [Cytophagales bacterium]